MALFTPVVDAAVAASILHPLDVAVSTSSRHPLFPFANRSSSNPAATFNNPTPEDPPPPPASVQRDRSTHSRRIAAANTKLPLEDSHPHLPDSLRGPLATKDGSDFPILPQFTYTVLSNGTLLQIPVSPDHPQCHLSDGSINLNEVTQSSPINASNSFKYVHKYNEAASPMKALPGGALTLFARRESIKKGVSCLAYSV